LGPKAYIDSGSEVDADRFIKQYKKDNKNRIKEKGKQESPNKKVEEDIEEKAKAVKGLVEDEERKAEEEHKKQEHLKREQEER
jgi:hypothetical protein